MNVLSVREGPVRCPFWLFRPTDKRNPRLSVPPAAGCLLQVVGRHLSDEQDIFLRFLVQCLDHSLASRPDGAI
jgi:hypothetical protein